MDHSGRDTSIPSRRRKEINLIRRCGLLFCDSSFSHFIEQLLVFLLLQIQLEEVDVQTGEEEEEMVHSVRAKLFKFEESLLDKGTGKKQWLERGVGDAKILKHRETGQYRFLMRQDKTMKIISNHVVDHRIVMTENAGSDRSWVWTAYDFANGETLEETIFAIRLKDSDIAAEFKKKYEEAMEAMKALEAGADGAPAPEADEAAEALAALSTGAGEEEETPGEEAKEE
jgi:Ran-binding protein 1